MVHTGFEGLDLIAGDKNLVGANLELVDTPRREFRLQDKVEAARTAYDYILIDCPPALDLLTLNALIAADSVLVPIQCEFFALEGISELMDTIERIRESFGHPLEIEGILLTMFDDRTNLTRQVADRSSRLLSGPSLQDRDSAQHPACRSAQPWPRRSWPMTSARAEPKATFDLAKEILDHEQKRGQSAQGTR